MLIFRQVTVTIKLNLQSTEIMDTLSSLSFDSVQAGFLQPKSRGSVEWNPVNYIKTPDRLTDIPG